MSYTYDLCIYINHLDRTANDMRRKFSRRRIGGSAARRLDTT